MYAQEAARIQALRQFGEARTNERAPGADVQSHVVALGFDPIWFGIMSMMMVAMGLVFPPVGLIAFIVSATAGVDLMKVYKGTSVLMLSIVATTVLLMIFPQIALWLPATMR